MNNREYEVNQIIYVMNGENDRIIPMLISEEIRRKTIDGEVVTYMVKGPEAKGDFNLAEMPGKVFDTLDDAVQHLRVKFDNWVNAQVEWTLSSQQTWYPNAKSKTKDV